MHSAIVNSDVLHHVFDYLVEKGVAHQDQREMFIRTFQGQNEAKLKFIPEKRLKRGGIIKKNGLGFWVSCEDNRLGGFTEQLNTEIRKMIEKPTE